MRAVKGSLGHSLIVRCREWKDLVGRAQWEIKQAIPWNVEEGFLQKRKWVK